MINREHILQKHARLWAREAVAAPHLFLGFDRAQATGGFTHVREKMRGVTAGTPDTLLMVLNFPDIWVEMKAPGNRPTPEQFAMGKTLMALGRHWAWVVDVRGYWAGLRGLGVPLHPNAAFLALHHDGGVASEIARAELAAGKAPKSYKPRPARPTVAQVRRVAKTGVWG